MSAISTSSLLLPFLSYVRFSCLCSFFSQLVIDAFLLASSFSSVCPPSTLKLPSSFLPSICPPFLSFFVIFFVSSHHSYIPFYFLLSYHLHSRLSHFLAPSLPCVLLLDPSFLPPSSAVLPHLSIWMFNDPVPDDAPRGPDDDSCGREI